MLDFLFAGFATSLWTAGTPWARFFQDFWEGIRTADSDAWTAFAAWLTEKAAWKEIGRDIKLPTLPPKWNALGGIYDKQIARTLG